MGLSSARAMTRLLVAIIENLGVHDRAGPRRAFGETDGEAEPRTSANGPLTVRPRGGHTGRRARHSGRLPLGAEIERIMTRPQPNYAEGGPRDSVTGLPIHHEDFDMPPPAAAPVQRAAPPPISPAPRKPVAPQPPEEQYAATANIPVWQRPFIAAPGVRYMRTPDRLLRRARDAAAPIVPIDPAAPIPPSEMPIDLDTTAIDTACFDTDFMDEVELLNSQDQVCLRYPPRPAAAPPHAERLRGRPCRCRPMTPTRCRRISSRPRRRPHSRYLCARRRCPRPRPRASPEAISARVTMAAVAPQPKRRPTIAMEWDYPSVELLAEPRKAEGTALTADMLEQNARLLETTLEDFGITRRDHPCCAPAPSSRSTNSSRRRA